MSLCHYIIVNLIAVEGNLPLFCFAFLSHRCPNVCNHNVCILCSFQRLVCQCELVAICLCKFQNLRVWVITLWASNRNFHAHFQTANDQRICHVVTVPNKAHLQTVKCALAFPNGHQVCEYLTRVAEIGQSVDNRNVAVFC